MPSNSTVSSASAVIWTWMATASVTGPIPGRMRAIASDLGFYEIFEQRGYDRPTLDQCLADTQMMDTLIGATMADAETYGIRGTPSFAIDGKLLDATHSWESLQPQIQAGLNAAVDALAEQWARVLRADLSDRALTVVGADRQAHAEVTAALAVGACFAVSAGDRGFA